jgi:hypothetical protein
MSLFLAAIFLFSVNSNASPYDAPPTPTTQPMIQKVEVLIGHVFVKKWGYQPSDNIEIIIDGYLPNSCYQLDETQIIPAGTLQLEAHQFALRNTATTCALGLVPFSVTKSLGQLPGGNYEIHFNIGSLPPLWSTFEVSDTRTQVTYPNVTAVEIAPSWNCSGSGSGNRPGFEMFATITGELPSLCTKIQRIQVQIEDDVVVVSPILISSSGECPQVATPFQSSVKLGNLEDGRYLLEVGSAHGDVLKTFNVLRGEP